MKEESNESSHEFFEPGQKEQLVEILSGPSNNSNLREKKQSLTDVKPKRKENVHTFGTKPKRKESHNDIRFSLNDTGITGIVNNKSPSKLKFNRLRVRTTKQLNNVLN